MIRIVRVVLAFMVFINFSRCQASENQSQANTQTELSQETIPSNIPADLKKEIEGLSSTLETERVAAAVSLAKMGKKAELAIPFLKKLLNDNNWVTMRTKTSDNTVFESRTSVSEQARLALVQIGGEEIVDYFINVLKDNLLGLGFTAIVALGEIGDSRAIRPLIAALKDNSGHVRSSAALALSKIGDPRAIQPLIQAFKNEPRRVAIGNALEKMTGEDFSEYKEWQKWWEQNKEDFVKNR